MKECKKFNELPEEVKEEVKETLKAWQGCYVQKRDGKYMVSIGIGLTAGDDGWRFVASFENYDIYTPEEIKKYAAEVWKGVEMF